MTTKHTPGPWHVGFTRGPRKGSEHVEVCDESNLPVALMPRTADDPLQEANARLIAAAPELLAALKDIAASADANDSRGIFEAINDARAAIAKAEGRQS